MKLYATLTSPYARKLRVMLAEKRIAFELIVVDLNARHNPVFELNPMAKVPTLVTDDGEMYLDSLMIAEMIDTMPGSRLIPDPPERWAALRVSALAQGMMDMTVLRLLESRRPEAQQSPEALAKADGKLARSLDWAEQRIGDRKLWVGDRFTIADISLAVALDYLDLRTGAGWRQKHPQLVAWLAAISPRPSLVETLPPRG